MPRTRPHVVVAASLLTLSTVVGCSSDGAGSEAPPPRPVAADAEPTRTKLPEVTSSPTTVPPKELAAMVSTAVLTADDVGNGVERQDRDDSLDVMTNDICARQWPSNAERKARAQRFYWADAEVAETVVSSEVVAYEAGRAAAALDEIERAIAECGEWKHRFGEMTDVTATEPPEGALADSFAWTATDEQTRRSYAYLAVYQRKDDVLSAVYVWAGSRDEARELATELVPTAAAKLQAS